jgi:uncharacterized protein (UPF0332 family)
LKEYNPDFSDLIKQGSLKEEKKIGKDQIMKLLNRAKKDLQTAKTLLDDDEAVSMTMVYDAMFHSANALIRLYNLRPGKVRQHIGLIEATGRILGKEVKDYIFRFDKLRIKRNQFEYQAIFDFSRIQIENNLIEAEKFVDIIEKFITAKINQQSFNI